MTRSSSRWLSASRRYRIGKCWTECARSLLQHGLAGIGLRTAFAQKKHDWHRGERDQHHEFVIVGIGDDRRLTRDLGVEGGAAECGGHVPDAMHGART